MSLVFKKAETAKDLEEVYNYNMAIFSDTPDFTWDVDGIKHEMEEGWELFSVHDKNEIVAALFYKKDKDGLFTKNTSVKIDRQGSGFSHEIKNFFEERAKEFKLSHIYHYCRIDNFRAYSLNEKHGYKKTDKTLSQGEVVEWLKIVK